MDRPAGVLGIRHVALFVSDLDKARHFYCGVLGMTVDWQPDPDNIYLTFGSDNLALHRARPDEIAGWKFQRLDHFGLAVRTMADVDKWAAYLGSRGVVMHKLPKTHRDGSRSFYVADPDDNVIQFIWYEKMQ